MSQHYNPRCFPANGTPAPAAQLAQPTPTVRPISMLKDTPLGERDPSGKPGQSEAWPQDQRKPCDPLGADHCEGSGEQLLLVIIIRIIISIIRLQLYNS